MHVRPLAHEPARAAVIEIVASVFTFHQSAHFALDLRQLVVGRAQQPDALVEEIEGLGEVELRIVQLRHDVLESGDLLLEGHSSSRFDDGRTSRATALTLPSRSSRSKGIPAENSSIERSVCPTSSRGTA